MTNSHTVTVCWNWDTQLFTRRLEALTHSSLNLYPRDTSTDLYRWSVTSHTNRWYWHSLSLTLTSKISRLNVPVIEWLLRCAFCNWLCWVLPGVKGRVWLTWFWVSQENFCWIRCSCKWWTSGRVTYLSRQVCPWTASHASRCCPARSCLWFCQRRSSLFARLYTAPYSNCNQLNSESDSKSSGEGAKPKLTLSSTSGRNSS